MNARLPHPALALLLALVGGPACDRRATPAGPDGVVAGGAVADGAVADGAVADGFGGVDAPVAGGPTGPVFGGERPVTVRLPAGYDPSERYPLLLVLHPWASDWQAIFGAEKLGYAALADAHGLLLVLPSGTAGGGNKYWNATPACCAGSAEGPDDVAYLGALIEEIRRGLNVDPGRVYIAGHSNGGFMAHRMACDRADLVAAIVSLAGAGPGDLVPCAPSRPVAVLQVHGDADTKVPYDGGRLRDDWPEFPGAEETIRAWGRLDRCQVLPRERAQPLDASIVGDDGRIDLDASIEGDETRKANFGGCYRNVAVELWTIEGGSHNPDLSSGAFARLTLAWLERQARR